MTFEYLAYEGLKGIRNQVEYSVSTLRYQFFVVGLIKGCIDRYLQ
jgi:hypothetical protein